MKTFMEIILAFFNLFCLDCCFVTVVCFGLKFDAYIQFNSIEEHFCRFPMSNHIQKQESAISYEKIAARFDSVINVWLY